MGTSGTRLDPTVVHAAAVEAVEGLDLVVAEGGKVPETYLPARLADGQVVVGDGSGNVPEDRLPERLSEAGLTAQTDDRIDVAFSGYVPPGVLVREVGDTSIPGDFPVGGLVFTKQPVVLRKFDGVGLPESTVLTTSTRGEFDNAFAVVAGALTFAGGVFSVPSAQITSQSVTWDGLAGAGKGFRFYMRDTGSPSGNAVIMKATDAGAAQLFALTINSNNQPQVRNSANSSVWTGTALTANKTYRFEVILDGAGYVTLRVYDLTGTLVQTSSSVNCGFGSTAVTSAAFGQTSAVSFPSSWSHLAIIDKAVEVGRYNAGVSV